MPTQLSSSILAVLSLSFVLACGGDPTSASESGSEGALHHADATNADVFADDDLERELHKAVDGRTYSSDTDANIDVLRAKIAKDEHVDAATVKKKFTGLAVTKRNRTALADLPRTDEQDFVQWFQSVDASPDSATTKALKRVRVLMNANLTELRVVFVGDETASPGLSMGEQIQIFIVGRSATGGLFAVHTRVNWS